MEYCHFSWTEAQSIPVVYRKWFIQRKQKEEEKIKEAREKAKKNAPAPKKQRTR